MSSWFNLELDTTGPIIELFAKSSSYYNNLVDIYVLSNKNLDDWSDAKITDCCGNDWSLIFTKASSNILYACVSLKNFSPGICKISIRTRDDLFNLSNTITHDILISEEIEHKHLNKTIINHHIIDHKSIAETKRITNSVANAGAIGGGLILRNKFFK